MRMVFPSQHTGRLFDELATDMGTIVETLFGDTCDRPRGAGGVREVVMRVPMDIDESDSDYTVTLDVPGVPIESVELEVHEDTLSIRGSRSAVGHSVSESDSDDSGDEKSEAPVADDSTTVKPLRRERSFGKFERKVRLPLPVEHDAVTAELVDGVLVVTLPKADPDKGKRRVPVARG